MDLATGFKSFCLAGVLGLSIGALTFLPGEVIAEEDDATVQGPVEHKLASGIVVRFESASLTTADEKEEAADEASESVELGVLVLTNPTDEEIAVSGQVIGLVYDMSETSRMSRAPVMPVQKYQHSIEVKIAAKSQVRLPIPASKAVSQSGMMLSLIVGEESFSLNNGLPLAFNNVVQTNLNRGDMNSRRVTVELNQVRNAE